MDISHSVPNGGFPNIYIVDDETMEDIESENKENKKDKGKKKKREFEPPGKLVQIKDILAKRRHVTPFISIAVDEEATK